MLNRSQSFLAVKGRGDGEWMTIRTAENSKKEIGSSNNDMYSE